MAQTAQQELDFFEKVGYAFNLINKSWEALKLNLSTFAMLVFLPLLLVLIASPLFILPAITNNDGVTAVTTALAIAAGILIALILILLVPALTITQLASVQGKKISFEQVYSQSKTYVLRYIGAAILSILIIATPMIISLLLVFIIIGIVLLPFAFAWYIIAPFFLYLVPYVLISENLSVTDSIKRSVELTKTNWQWVLAIFVVAIAISFINIVPFIGAIIVAALSIAYYCMPAYVFVHNIQDSKPVTAPEAVVTTKTASAPKPATKKAKTTKKK